MKKLARSIGIGPADTRPLICKFSAWCTILITLPDYINAWKASCAAASGSATVPSNASVVVNLPSGSVGISLGRRLKQQQQAEGNVNVTAPEGVKVDISNLPPATGSVGVSIGRRLQEEAQGSGNVNVAAPEGFKVDVSNLPPAAGTIGVNVGRRLLQADGTVKVIAPAETKVDVSNEQVRLCDMVLFASATLQICRNDSIDSFFCESAVTWFLGGILCTKSMAASLLAC